MTAHDDRARDEQWIASTDRPDADIYDEQPAPTAREIPADNDRSTRLVRAIDEVEGNHDALIMVRAGDVISLIAEIKELAPTAREIPADELAEAEAWLRRVGAGGYSTIKDTAEHLPVIKTEYDERGRERDAARAEVERLRRRVDELRPMAAHGVRNPPEVIEEMAAELERLRARVAELEPIAQRAREVRDRVYLGSEMDDQLTYILTGEESS